ncbi:hypothetical protein ACQEV2_41990 [Streptomyces sp. CA-251387]|uniref:hypothetical protein n=1 Tax=Streptomyces sp. CA-251387 TaxID=3240064 RepID=UPI003D8C0805
MLLHDAPSSLPGYQRRLITSGYLSRFPLGHGLSHLTAAGLDLGDLMIDVVLNRAGEFWPLDVLAHPPLLADPWQREFAGSMSEHFDCFRLSGNRFLWFDTNVSHLDALRERLGPGLETCAVASTEGLYRPVAAPRPMIRDEFVFPFVGLHIATLREKVAEEWGRLIELVRTVADAVGLPLLLLQRPGPVHYSRNSLAALLPAPGDRLEPWMLAYELGDRFRNYLGVPEVSVLEFGISQRALALGAHNQRGRAARYGSKVSPTQVFVEGAGEGPPGLRLARVDAGGITCSGLAPVAADLEAGNYRLLSEEYRRIHRLNRPLAKVLAEEDRQLVAERSLKLADLLAERYVASPRAGVDSQGWVVAAPFDGYRDQFLCEIADPDRKA